MLRGYRRIILAAVGWLILCGAKPPAEQPNGRAGAAQASPAATPIASPSPTPTASPTSDFIAYSGYDPDPCYHAKDHDTADLCAQWRAAIAAEKAAHEARRASFWTIIATLLSAAAVTGLLVTIRQTQAALRIARHSANIAVIESKRARREAREAADNAEKQLRAYLDFDGVMFIPDPLTDGLSADNHGIAVRVRNFGSTPASPLHVTTQITVRNAVGTVIKHTPPDPLDFGSVAPNDHIRKRAYFSIDPETWDEIAAGRFATQVRVVVKYGDAFGREHDLASVFESLGTGKKFGFVAGTRHAT